TCPKDELRSGPKAVELATRACEQTEWKDGNLMDTLAAAYAECGRFEEAAAMAHTAIDLAPPEIREEGRSHWQLYQSRKPYRSKPASAADRTGLRDVPWWKRRKKR